MLKWMEFCAFKNWNIVDLQYHVSFKCTAQRFSYIHICTNRYGLPRWPSSKESACNPGVAGDTGSIPGLRTSPGGGHGNLLQYSCLENPMDRGAWQAIIHKVSQSVRHDWSELAHTCHTHTHILLNWCVYIYTYMFFQIISPYMLLHKIEYSFLCYTVGSCW